MHPKLQLLLDYIQQYRPSFTQEIRGASSQDIERLESLLGRRLPAVHRAFLECMGAQTGPLKLYEGAMDPTIEALLEYSTEETWRPPAAYVLFAMDTGPQGSDLFLDTSTSDSDPAVVRGEPSQDFKSRCRLDHESLSDALFSAALISIRMPLLPFRASMHAAPRWSEQFGGTGLSRLDEMARRLGFMRLPFGASWSPSYERGDAVIDAYEAPGYLPSFEIATQSAQELGRITEILKDNLGLIRSSE